MLDPDIQRRTINLLKQAGVAALYMLLSHIVHLYFRNNSVVSVFEPVSGLALAAFLIGGKRYFWSLFLGSFLINVMTGITLMAAIAIAAGNVLEALAGAWLLTRKGGFDLAIQSLRSYLLLILAGSVGCIIGALNGATTLLVSGLLASNTYFINLVHWWMGDVLGIALVTPMILAYWHVKNDWIATKRITEAALLLGLTFLAGQVVFLGWFHTAEGFIDLIAKGYWMFLFVSWVAVRLRIHGTVIVLIMVATQALLGAYDEVGFFADDIAQAHLTNYWFYMVTLSVVGMALTAYFTEYKLMADALRTNIASLRAILNNAPYMVWLKDTESRYVNVNKVFVDYARLKDAGQVIGKTDFNLWPKELAEKFRDDDKEVMASLKQKHIEELSFDGNKIHWVETFKIPVIDEKGNVLGTTGFSHDITERKQTEDELNQFLFTLDQTLDGIYMFRDSDFRFIYVNEGAINQVGYARAELQEMTPLDIEPEFTLERFQEMVQPLRDGMQPSHTFETVHRHKNGCNISVEVFLQYVRKEGNEPRFMAIVHDITERKIVENQLRDLTRHLQSVREEEKTNIAREIHDVLGCTLAALKVETYCLKDKLPENKETAFSLGHIREMSRLIEEAANIIRNIITGLHPPVLDDLGLCAALEWQADQFQKRTGIKCRVNCIGDKGNLDKLHSITLFRICQESLTNVMRHAGASNVDIEYHHSEEEVIISIVDNGCGLPRDFSDKPGSFGMLGMRGRVEQLGGTISFDATHGGGLSVTAIFPLPAG